ncbi:hypothetical protein IJJ02_01310 [Candidatus Saccharibacteria bacterium]|nr:hypothetical protein [Candidatus Saccharibacteria bacterium]
MGERSDMMNNDKKDRLLYLGHASLMITTADGIYTMTVEEASQVADEIQARHSIPYHMNPEKLFDAEIAERFTGMNKMVVKDGEEIWLEKG